MKHVPRILLALALCMALAFSMVACGGGGGSSSPAGGNTAPVANAGPDQNVSTDSVVTLDGSMSTDADGDALTYSWSFTSNPGSAVLSDATTVNPTFTPTVDGSYVLSLVVNDGTMNSAADTVTVTASTANSAPVANAGPNQNVTTSSVVTLDGSGSTDANADTITYNWTFTSVPGGSIATLFNPTTVNPTFTPDVDGAYVISLMVNDGTVNSVADTVTVTAATANSAPVANAGPDQNVSTGSLVTLDGSGSTDADGDTLTYIWSFTSNPGSAVLSDATAVNPTFTPTVDGAYVLSLVVNDGTVNSAADTVTVTASTAPSDNADGTVTDNVTGLMWQKCSVGQTNDASCTGRAAAYNWYEATGTADATYNSGGAANVCGNLSLGGHADWRLPSKKELVGIVDYGYAPTIDATAFPNTDGSRYWSSTTYASYPSRAWYVNFGVGYVNGGGEAYDGYVRCVRGSEPPAQSFTDNADGTVTDNVTGLMWQKCSAGQTNDASCTGTPTYYTWYEATGTAEATYNPGGATDVCGNLSLGGHADWRLPNVKELESITDDGTYSPAIDATAFPNTNASYYWSSTTRSPYYAWYVNFGVGFVDYYAKTLSYNVRCVR